MIPKSASASSQPGSRPDGTSPLKISPKFTINDIHAIRLYNYEVTKDLSLEDKLRYYNDKAFRHSIEKQKTSQA